MCSNYLIAGKERLHQHFGVSWPSGEFKPEAYPRYLAPIIRPPHDEGDAEKLESVAACFGMVPHWADLKLATKTYNARTETVAKKPSYRNAWGRRQFCIIPLYRFVGRVWTFRTRTIKVVFSALTMSIERLLYNALKRDCVHTLAACYRRQTRH